MVKTNKTNYAQLTKQKKSNIFKQEERGLTKQGIYLPTRAILQHFKQKQD